jgi:hypothetical protein
MWDFTYAANMNGRQIEARVHRPYSKNYLGLLLVRDEAEFGDALNSIFACGRAAGFTHNWGVE